MTTQDGELENWVVAVTSAMEESAAMLGFGSCTLEGRHDDVPGDLRGAHISIVGDHGAVHLAVLSTEAGNDFIARTMLMMEEGEELSAEDVADTVGEIANIVAGGVKGALREWDGGLKLGLPVFIRGHIERGSATQAKSLDFSVDGTPVTVAVIVHGASPVARRRQDAEHAA